MNWSIIFCDFFQWWRNAPWRKHFQRVEILKVDKKIEKVFTNICTKNIYLYNKQNIGDRTICKKPFKKKAIFTNKLSMLNNWAYTLG